MIYSIFPKHTATVYSRYPTMNASEDEILELNKTVSSSEVVGTYNTRILLDFDLYNNSASMAAEGITPASYSLSLYVANSNTPNPEFKIQLSDVGNAWGHGYGRSTHIPKTEVGVSWDHPFPNNTWTGDNGPSNITSIFPQTNYSSLDKDLDMIDVTELAQHVGSTIGNDKGMLLRRPNVQEVDSKKYGYVNFYSAKTSTIYKPRLFVSYDDYLPNTGSLTALDIDREYYVYQSANPGTYKINSTPKFRFTGRAKYPTATYTSSTAALVEYLPTSSYYSLVDVRTGETIVPFDTTYTKISCDSSGNFANLKLSGIYPDRLYQFHIRVDHNGTSTYHILDDMFRVYE
tara:strand:- start:8 stop:1045 length:1038 start_codon:yes stop_codon:yes gene_type:complete